MLFFKNCVDGIISNIEKINRFVNEFLMLVTVLNLYIGYDRAVKIVKYVYIIGFTLKMVVVLLRMLIEEEFDIKV